MTKAEDSAKKKRASKPRSKQGCAQCRRRRVKCDEEHPACRRCIKRGLECPGYATPDTKERAVVPIGKVSTPDAWESLQITSYNLPFTVPGGQRERKALHYFCVDATPHESATRYFTSDFWHNFVMQHCQHDAATRQAVVALSSVHLEYTTAKPEQLYRGYLAKTSPESLEAYNKAVGKLRRYIEQQASPSRRTVLICCAIFFCLETIRGDHTAARLHFKNGCDILRAWRVSREQRSGAEGEVDSCEDDGEKILKPQDDFGHLTELFGRLDLESGVHDDQHDMQTSWPFMNSRGGPLEDSEMAAAPAPMRRLSGLVNASYRCASQYREYQGMDAAEVPLDVREEKRLIERGFEAWALGAEERNLDEKAILLPDALTSNERLGPFPKWAFMRLINKFQQQQAEDGHSGETFHSNPYRTMRMSEAIMEWDRRRRLPISDSRIANGYSPDIGVVAPLSLLAYRTSIAQIQDAAPALLPTLTRLSNTNSPSSTTASPEALLVSSPTSTLDGPFYYKDEAG